MDGLPTLPPPDPRLAGTEYGPVRDARVHWNLDRDLPCAAEVAWMVVALAELALIVALLATRVAA